MNPDIEFRSEMTVEFRQQVGDDVAIAHAAWVSSGTSITTSDPKLLLRVTKLINALIRQRHGTPFEHGSLTVYIEAPIFVTREIIRHRIGVSPNEMSGRYRELKGVFHLPDPLRPVVKAQPFNPMKPQFVLAQADEFAAGIELLCETYQTAWVTYQNLLTMGWAPEVAREILPIGVYSAMYLTFNPRSLMHFLSLRIHDPEATYPSFPQAEIQAVATQIEALFKHYWPLTHAAFCDHGRVGP